MNARVQRGSDLSVFVVLLMALLCSPVMAAESSDSEESTSSQLSSDEAAAEAAGDAAAAAVTDFLSNVENLAATQNSANLGQEGPDTLAHAQDMVEQSAVDAGAALTTYAEAVADALRLTPDQLGELMASPPASNPGGIIVFEDSLPPSTTNGVYQTVIALDRVAVGNGLSPIALPSGPRTSNSGAGGGATAPSTCTIRTTDKGQIAVKVGQSIRLYASSYNARLCAPQVRSCSLNSSGVPILSGSDSYTYVQCRSGAVGTGGAISRTLAK